MVGERPSLLARARASIQANELDQRIAAGEDVRSSPALSARGAVLTGHRHTAVLAAGFERALHACRHVATEGPALTQSSRETVAAAPVVAALMDRLRDGRPVHPRGVALAERVLTDGSGPFYRTTWPASARRAAQAALEAL